MPRNVPALAILACLVGAGCVAPPVDFRAVTPNAPESFELQGCMIQEIIAGVPPESLADHLPAGFVAEPFPAEGRSGLIALTTICPGPEPTRFAMVIIPLVAVPDGYARENASAQGIITSIVVEQGETTWDTLQAWGYGPTLSRGTVVAEDVAPMTDALARVGDAVVERKEGGRFELGTTVRGVPRSDDGNFLRFFMVHEKKVIGVWDCDLTGNHLIYSGEAHLRVGDYAPLPDGPTAGLGFHERSDVFAWKRVNLTAT